MIQNHMFQLLSLVAMEPPSSFDAAPVRDEKVKVLNAIRPMQPEEILQRTVRGQYGEGFVDGQKLPAYRAEPSVARDVGDGDLRRVEARRGQLAMGGRAVLPAIGKRLAKHVTEIVIQFRKPPLLAFGKIQIQDLEPNRLILSIQPEEGITIEIKAKRPGATMNLTQVNLDFNYSDFGPVRQGDRATSACSTTRMTGDTTLFHRADTVEAAWRIATPILDVWGSIPPRDFPNYTAGQLGSVRRRRSSEAGRARAGATSRTSRQREDDAVSDLDPIEAALDAFEAEIPGGEAPRPGREASRRTGSAGAATSPSASGGRCGRTTRRTAIAGTSSRTITPAAAPIAGARTGCWASPTASAACASLSPCGTARIRS